MQSSVVAMPLILWLAARNADLITELYCTLLARAAQGLPGKIKVRPGADSGVSAGRFPLTGVPAGPQAAALDFRPARLGSAPAKYVRI